MTVWSLGGQRFDMSSKLPDQVGAGRPSRHHEFDVSTTAGRNVGFNVYVVCVRGVKPERVGDRIEGLRCSGADYYRRQKCEYCG